jgi:thiol-disulfide isomerase/thioredoxin
MFVMPAALALFAVVSPAAEPQPFKLTHVPTGMMKAMGYYAPQRLTLAEERPATITKAPEGLEAPLYGAIQIAGRPGAAYHVIVDEPEGKPSRLFIDANGDGDLTNDPAAEWKPRESKGPDGASYTMYSGSASVDLGDTEHPRPAGLGVYRFDKTDPGRAAQKMLLLYYRDYGVEGRINLGGKDYDIKLSDEFVTGDFRGKEIDPADEKASSGVTLAIDVNGNGKIERQGEQFDVRKPFNIGGTTYELADVARDGLSLSVRKSDKTVAEIPLPPDHTPGKPITAFEATLMDGKTVRFPGDYKGKVVLIDFWATWCGPCMKEMPNVAAAYKKYHPHGFEVLGISFDRENAEDKIKEVAAAQDMPWPQVYEGKFWTTRIGKLYAINSIPAAFLVDGDTGTVIAANVRGEALGQAIEKALKDKNRN